MAQQMPQAQQIAKFALSKKYNQLLPDIADQLKKHLLDATGSMIQCINSPTIGKLMNQARTLSAQGKCEVPLIGKTSFDRAAQLYTALIRYPDFMDNFLGKEATCHPSDNIGPLLAGAFMENSSGKDFLISMAVGYEIECRMVEEIPVMIKGFDHTLLLAYSITASLCRLLQLTEEQTANALGMAGSSLNPLVACRASYTTEWKGLQSSLVALGCYNIVMLAKEGMTGPVEIFEGNKGFEEEFGMKLEYNWNKDRFELIRKCILKGFNAEVHTQSVLEGALELKRKHEINPSGIEQITVKTFLTTYHIVGGGAYGDRMNVHSKEQADHSLPYVLAATLLDDHLYPEQLLPSRINKSDVQRLLKKVKVETKFPLHKPMKVAGMIDPYTKAYPDKMMAEIIIKMKDGRSHSIEVEDFYGFHTRPMSWEDVILKFRKLTGKVISVKMQDELIEIISNLEQYDMKELISLISRAGKRKPSAKQVKKAA
jgi:2-methylcitrate dehydratase